MAVDAVGPTLPTAKNENEGATASAVDVDYNTFLKLLIAQMKNQDPLNPAESTEYVAQLATFSQVEQTIQMNNKLDNMISSLTLTQSEAVIGRTVTSADGLVSGEVRSVRVASDGLTAYLENGQTINIGPGVTIS